MERQVVTRFNPSCNSALHLGHLYTILVNEAYAHSRGGRFIVRFDDSHPDYRRRLGDRLDRIRDGQREIIEWLGIPVDDWISQKEMMPRTEAELERVWHRLEPMRMDDAGPVFISKKGVEYYRPWPYDPRLTAEHVVTDYLLGVTVVIRGEDLATEYCQYCALCEEFGYPRLPHIYLPRVRSSEGELSKSGGATPIADYRTIGYTPDELKRALFDGCTIHYPNGWAIENLHSNPKVNL